MHLFIDTNIFLSFYHLTSDDLEELNKLIVLLRGKEVTLWLPEQVRLEARRNRDNKIADALKRLKEQKLNAQFPQLCKDYPEFAALRQHLREYEEYLKRLVTRITEDTAANCPTRHSRNQRGVTKMAFIPQNGWWFTPPPWGECHEHGMGLLGQVRQPHRLHSSLL